MTLIDDLDPDLPADETIEFGMEGVTYEIDLAAQNAGKLRDTLADYVGAARRTGGRLRVNRSNRNGAGTLKPSSENGQRRSSVRVPTATTPAEKDRNRSIREWCSKNRVPCAARGRLAAAVIRAFDENDPSLAR